MQMKVLLYLQCEYVLSLPLQNLDQLIATQLLSEPQRLTDHNRYFLSEVIVSLLLKSYV